jgi:hypothetical protein
MRISVRGHAAQGDRARMFSRLDLSVRLLCSRALTRASSVYTSGECGICGKITTPYLVKMSADYEIRRSAGPTLDEIW